MNYEKALRGLDPDVFVEFINKCLEEGEPNYDIIAGRTYENRLKAMTYLFIDMPVTFEVHDNGYHITCRLVGPDNRWAIHWHAASDHASLGSLNLGNGSRLEESGVNGFMGRIGPLFSYLSLRYFFYRFKTRGKQEYFKRDVTLMRLAL